MANEKIDLRDEIITYKFELGLLQKVPCTKPECRAYKSYLENGDSLPEGVYRFKDADGKDTDEFYTIYEQPLTIEEKKDFLTFRQLKALNSIKSGVLLAAGFSAASTLLVLVMLLLNV